MTHNSVGGRADLCDDGGFGRQESLYAEVSEQDDGCQKTVDHKQFSEDVPKVRKKGFFLVMSRNFSVKVPNNRNYNGQ